LKFIRSHTFDINNTQEGDYPYAHPEKKEEKHVSLSSSRVSG